MKLLVLGSTGLLGQAVAAEAGQRGWEVKGAARSGARISIDIAEVAALTALLEKEPPDLVFNCAALVDVAACEADPGQAWRINARPLSVLADWSKRTGKPLVQISTDHWFTGVGNVAHDEDALVTFMNEYARTKYAGESFALSAPKGLVLRTSIVGIRGWERPTFAEWALRIVEEQQSAILFADAYTSSIDTASFARAALDLVDRGAAGLLNLAASETYSKEAFVRGIARHLRLSMDHAAIGSVKGLAPPRPSSLGLDVHRAEAILGYGLPNLEEVLAAIIQQHREHSKNEVQPQLQDR